MTENYEKLVRNIREKGIEVYLAPKENEGSIKLTQTAVRFMIERNLERLGKESHRVENFAQVSEKLKDVIDHS